MFFIKCDYDEKESLVQILGGLVGINYRKRGIILCYRY